MKKNLWIIKILLTTACLSVGYTQQQSSPLAFDDTDVKAIVNAIDQDQNNIITREEASQWLFADLLLQAVIDKDTNSIALDQMLETLIVANQNNDELIDSEAYQDRVLEAYKDGFLDKTEIAYMSGENIFPMGSEYVDEGLTVDSLMQLDMDGDERLTMQELLQKDLSAIVDEKLSVDNSGNVVLNQQRTEFVTKP